MFNNWNKSDSNESPLELSSIEGAFLILFKMSFQIKMA